MSISKKLIIMATFLVIVIVFNYTLAHQAIDELEHRQKSIELTGVVLIKSEALLGHLKDAETGQRGYLLTLDPQYLEPYYAGIVEASVVISELTELVADDKVKKDILAEVTQLKNEKLSELSLTIDNASSGNIDKAIEIVKENTGKSLMDDIRVKLNKFQVAERKLYTQREVAREEAHKTVNAILLSEIIILVGVVLFSVFYTKIRLVTPLLLIKKELDKIESGEDSKGINLSQDDEIGLLSNALDKMLHRLQSRSEQLDAMVLEIEKERDKALLASTTDSLTGLANRRRFEKIGCNELRRAHREKYTINLIMIDIDYFKSINDIYGHAAGDNTIKEVADCLKSAARRPNDFVFRIGGEEFVFLTSGMDEQTANTFADSLRLNIEMLRIPNSGSDVSKYVTISAGVTTFIPSLCQDIYTVLHDADKCLYEAKKLGRNCVISHN